jgi:membrane protease YdiL (CAAX protease family)
MREASPGVRFFRLCAQVSAVLLFVYLGIFASFFFQPTYLSHSAIVLRILYGVAVFAAGFALFARRVRPLDLLGTFPHSVARNFWLLSCSFLAGCALCLVITLTRDWWPLRIGTFQQTILATKDLTVPMGGIWMIHSLGEELFFRAFIYQELKAIFRPTMAILIAALFFAFAHLDPAGIPRNILISLVVIFCYEKSGNFYAAVAAHTGLNTCAQYVIYQLREGWSAPYGGLILAFVTAVGLPLVLQLAAEKAKRPRSR